MNEIRTEIEALQNMLVSTATGHAESDSEYIRLRQLLVLNSTLNGLTPQFVRTCRSLGQFWQFIKHKFGTYAERRGYIWEEFKPLLDALERGVLAPSDDAISTSLKKVDAAHVQAAWSKALERRTSDPYRQSTGLPGPSIRFTHLPGRRMRLHAFAVSWPFWPPDQLCR